MKLTVIGCSPAWPNPGGAHAGYLVEHEGHRLLLDCGPGVLGRLREREDWPTIHTIAITHFHLDHWGDLVPWVWGSFYRADHGDVMPALWVHPGGEEHLAALGDRLGFPDMFERAFDLHEYREGAPFAAGNLTVEPLRLPHYTLETYGFRVTDGRSTLAYSGDTGPSDLLVQLAQDADLFVCEATLERGDKDGLPRGHLSLDEALAAHEASGARSLLVTHRPSELSVPQGISLAFDGLELEIAP